MNKNLPPPPPSIYTPFFLDGLSFKIYFFFLFYPKKSEILLSPAYDKDTNFSRMHEFMIEWKEGEGGGKWVSRTYSLLSPSVIRMVPLCIFFYLEVPPFLFFGREDINIQFRDRNLEFEFDGARRMTEWKNSAISLPFLDIFLFLF